MEWVTISRVFSPAEADLVRSRLEAAGFLVTLRNLGAALAIEGYSMVTGGIWIQVPADQQVEAKALLDAPPDASPDPAP